MRGPTGSDCLADRPTAKENDHTRFVPSNTNLYLFPSTNRPADPSTGQLHSHQRSGSQSQVCQQPRFHQAMDIAAIQAIFPQKKSLGGAFGEQPMHPAFGSCDSITRHVFFLFTLVFELGDCPLSAASIHSQHFLGESPAWRTTAMRSHQPFHFRWNLICPSRGGQCDTSPNPMPGATVPQPTKNKFSAAPPLTYLRNFSRWTKSL